MRIKRNVSIDLVTREGNVVRPDFFATDAMRGALFLGEVKNLDHVALRAQIATYVDIAQANKVPLHLFVPRHATFSSPLQRLVDDGHVVRVGLNRPHVS
jgi:hypothetical protein